MTCVSTVYKKKIVDNLVFKQFIIYQFDEKQQRPTNIPNFCTFFKSSRTFASQHLKKIDLKNIAKEIIFALY